MLGNNHVFFLPYLMGERSPINNTDAIGLFIGIRPDTTRKDMVQAVLEGVAFSFCDNLEIAKSLGIDVSLTTICGGEPPMQDRFLSEIISKLDCHIAIQTSGYAPKEIFRRIVDSIDYVMMDIKIADRNSHKEYTGVYNDIILDNFEYLKTAVRNI